MMPDWLRKTFRVLRPVVAYVFACLVAAMFLILTYAVVESPMPQGAMLSPDALPLAIAVLTGVLVVIMALPALLLVWRARRKAWPRGWADALLPPVLVFVLWGLFWATQYTEFSDWWRGFLTATTGMPAALAGGLSYWLAAGRPGASSAARS